MSALTRRRLLSIAACAALAGSARHDPAPRLTWRGVAFGGDVAITLDGPEAITRPALARARLEIEAYEARFSLFRADSDLVRLNAQGALADLDPHWHAILQLSDRLHQVTDGLFDPSIQPLWLAHATGGDTERARALVGWDRIIKPGDGQRGLRLGAGQALSFNGIAQGAATDAVRDVLHAAGMRRVLVDIGEVATLGGPWRLGIADPAFGQIVTLPLADTALAVSSPGALQLDAQASHILHPRGLRHPRWSTVAVRADSAAVADGLSTAGCFMTVAQMQSAARRIGGVAQLIAQPQDGRAPHVITI